MCTHIQAIIACRALANLLEAMPHAAPQVAVCAPSLCHKVCSVVHLLSGPVVAMALAAA